MTIRGLDNWITGHYGEDQFRDSDEGRDEAIADDDGMRLLNGAMDYLRRQGRMYSADDEDGAQAFDILSDCMHLVITDYECCFCARPMPKKNSYCSAKCAKADAEGW